MAKSVNHVGYEVGFLRALNVTWNATPCQLRDNEEDHRTVQILRRRRFENYTAK